MIQNINTPFTAEIAEIEAKVPECYKNGLDRISVTMDDRLRTTGGISVFSRLTQRDTVKLNASLFATLNHEQKMEILTHELAHAVLHVNNKFVKHGWEWQNLHRKLGGTAERCHKHKVQLNLRRRYVIQEKRTGNCYLVTVQKWNRIYGPAITNGRIPYNFVGVIGCDLNARTYRWLTLRMPELRTVPLVKNLKLAA